MAERWKAGDRVRLTSVPWEKRRGCLATVVNPPEPGVYPDHRGIWKDEVLVLLDDDPLAARSAGSTFGAFTVAQQHDRGWTCTVAVGHLVPADVG